MINNRHLNKAVVALIFLSLLICALIVYLAQVNPNTKAMQYESKLFGDEIISIDIQVDEKDWQELLDAPTAKEYIPADLIINGEMFSSVGLRTKGNSSLSQVAQKRDSNRYSIHFKFNHYQKGQTFYGLDAFCINNLVGDNTYMKDYLSHDIMNYIGVPAPLMNYAKVTVNGEDFGFYLALERYEKAFLDRVYNTSGGQLYNVKIQMGQHGGNPPDENKGQNKDAPPNPADGPTEPPNNAGFPRGNFNPDNIEQNGTGMPGIPQDNIKQNPPGQNWPPQGDQNRDAGGFPQDMGGGFPGGMGDGFPQDMGGGFPQDMGGGFPQDMGDGFPGGMRGGRGGGDLVYIDDDISSYSSIFDNAEFKKNSDKDKQRVITAIKNLNEGTNLEQYFDVDEILRYLAAHTVVVNLDSYSSTMAQNYYIYERDGKISILPWDYSLSFGGFQGGNASNTINFPIDTPVSGVSMEDRPLINKLLEVPEYKERYHEYLNQIIEGYFKSGIFEGTITALDAKINDYVKNDTTSFTTYEKYTASLPILKKLGVLRTQSIEGQLNGAIPSTTEGQTANRDSLISDDGINLSALGSFMGGGGDRNPGGQGRPGAQDGQDGWGGFDNPGEMPDMSMIREAMSILQDSGRQISDELREKLLDLGLNDEHIKQLKDVSSNLPKGGFENQGNRDNFPGQDVPGRQGRAITQGGKTAENTTDPSYMLLIGILLLIIVAVTFLLSRFKKKY